VSDNKGATRGTGGSDRGWPPLVVAVVGSPRPGGNTSILVDAALSELERRGAAVDKIMLRDHRIAPCLGHDTCGDLEVCPQGDDAGEVLAAVYAADGLLLATPVYYENVSAQMKAFIDRNVFQYNHEVFLTPRVVGLLVVTAETGLEDTLGALRRFVALSTESEIPTFSMGGFADTAGAAAGDDELLAAARRLGADMADVLFR
jgi:multimeric flavodoxin WrbA